MNRVEVLRQEREKIMANISNDSGNRAKWLIELIDVDDELEEIMRTERRINLSHNLSRVKKEKSA